MFQISPLGYIRHFHPKCVLQKLKTIQIMLNENIDFQTGTCHKTKSNANFMNIIMQTLPIPRSR